MLAIGPSVSEELTENGGLGLLVALGAVMVYIMCASTGKFAIGAVTALVHDVVIVVGAFSVFQWTFNLPGASARCSESVHALDIQYSFAIVRS